MIDLTEAQVRNYYSGTLLSLDSGVKREAEIMEASSEAQKENPGGGTGANTSIEVLNER